MEYDVQYTHSGHQRESFRAKIHHESAKNEAEVQIMLTPQWAIKNCFGERHTTIYYERRVYGGARYILRFRSQCSFSIDRHEQKPSELLSSFDMTLKFVGRSLMRTPPARLSFNIRPTVGNLKTSILDVFRERECLLI